MNGSPIASTHALPSTLRHPLRVVAHRGFSARHPDNTLAAFEAAIEAQADAIELDVQLTRDRVPVVLHDSPYASRVALDATVPTLAEVFERIGGRIVLDVEIKPDAFEERPRADAIERQVVDLIRRYGLEDIVFLSSFEPRVLARLPADLPRALVVEDAADADAVIRAAREIRAFAVVPDERTLGAPELTTFAEADLVVVPYTVDDPDRARELLRWGVHGVITNDPEGIRRALGP